ncbi:hypothetical protein [Yoonia sp. SS1-5]|uniref:Uncharacterized protein n=1 Tax=Yoonia rhodophyticola TaxID=3137370 RepID=A0AAN0M782_9RHOB
MAVTFDWDGFVQGVEDGVKTLAKNSVGDAVDHARSDAKDFVELNKKSIKRWGEALKAGTISKDDFEFLVGGQKSLAKMHALKALGLSQARLERFRKGLMSLVVRSAFNAVGI